MKTTDTPAKAPLSCRIPPHLKEFVANYSPLGLTANLTLILDEAHARHTILRAPQEPNDSFA